MMSDKGQELKRKKAKRKSQSVRTSSKLPEGQRIKKRAELRKQQEKEELRRKNKKSNKKTNTKSSKKQKTNKNPKAKKISILTWLLWLLQVASSGLLIFCIYWLDIIPDKFLIAFSVLLFLFAALSIVISRRDAKRGKLQFLGKLLSLLIVAACLVGSFYVYKANVAIKNVTAKMSDNAGTNSEDLTSQGFNVYISGIDVYGDLSQSSRSDVNQIMTINPNTKKILLTTTPRDYYVTIPGISGDQKDKLTHAGIYGVETSMATLENLYNVSIPFYIRVNFTSVIDIIDLMGGVDVESEYAFTTSKAAGCVVDIKKGTNHLNGEEALAFVRERKALEDGDNQRGKDQQALIRAMIKKMLSPDMIYKASGIIDSVAGNVETNLSETQIKSLIKMQLNDMSDWDIDSVAANGETGSREWCYSYTGNTLYVTLVDEESVAEITQKIKDVLDGK